MLKFISNSLTLNKKNKLSAFAVAVIMLSFGIMGILATTIISVWQEMPFEFRLSTLGFAGIILAFLSVWGFIFFLFTAFVCRFTSDTILNYLLLGLSWALSCWCVDFFALDSRLGDIPNIGYCAVSLAIGLIASAAIELRLRKRPRNAHYKAFKDSDLLDDNFQK